MKNEPKCGTKIILIETYVKSRKFKTETFGDTIYYVDTKRRIVWEEKALDVTQFKSRTDDKRYYYTWAEKKNQHTLRKLLRKYDSDFGMFKHMFSKFEIKVTELGVL